MVEIAEILAERGSRYGKFTDHAFIAQLIKAAMSGDFHQIRILIDGEDQEQSARVRKALLAKWQALAADQREALEMNAHKVARILNGDPDYSDSWRDIAGYATLVADRLDGKVV